MSKFSFNIDKRQIQEGENITVSWNCESPDMICLSLWLQQLQL